MSRNDESSTGCGMCVFCVCATLSRENFGLKPPRKVFLVAHRNTPETQVPSLIKARRGFIELISDAFIIK